VAVRNECPPAVTVDPGLLRSPRGRVSVPMCVSTKREKLALRALSVTTLFAASAVAVFEIESTLSQNGQQARVWCAPYEALAYENFS
jgi:hypothetical protein